MQEVRSESMNRINASFNKAICVLLTVLMCSPAFASRASLRAQRTGGVCGDGVVDSHEVCDEGKELNGSGPGHCNWDCQGFTPANTTVPSGTTPQGSTSGSTQAQTTTTTVAPTTTPAPGGLSDGAIIGIVFGSVAGAALLGVGIFLIAKACARGGAAGAAVAGQAAPAAAGQAGQVVVDL